MIGNKKKNRQKYVDNDDIDVNKIYKYIYI